MHLPLTEYYSIVSARSASYNKATLCNIGRFQMHKEG